MVSCNNDKDADLNIKRIGWTINAILNKITDKAHPIVRSAGSVLGAFVASGYITATEPDTLICEAIASHWYLQKDIKGYQATARTYIQYGKAEGPRALLEWKNR